MNTIQLTTDDNKQIHSLLQQVKSEYYRADSEQFLNDAYLLAGDLPRSLRSKVLELKVRSSHFGVTLIQGFEFRQPLADTPKSWYLEDCGIPNTEADYLGAIVSSILGDPFGFETQQEGKIIHDILPIKGMEHVQAGASSLANLSFHTEDAFHPHRGEFLVFCYMRNPCNVGTSVASIKALNLPDPVKNVLFEPRFYVLPDNTHSVGEEVKQTISVLFGAKDSPFIRFDPDFTFANDGDKLAASALQFLFEEIVANRQQVPAQAGDLCIIDNFKVVHGRAPFKAKFDGKDRWLKRFNVAVDLKKSMDYRSGINSRLLAAEIK